MQPTIPEPVSLNIEQFFSIFLRAVGGFFKYIFSYQFLDEARFFATLLVIFLIAFIIYLLVRLYEIKQEGKKKTISIATSNEVSTTTTSTGGITLPVKNETWEAIRSKLLSDNQSDWRLAIIEGDIYMDRLLDDKGFHGDTTSDKLKQITPGQLASIQVAWEAHKVRNRIAHDGAAFTLTQPEARRVLSYFEIVFRDLGAIV